MALTDYKIKHIIEKSNGDTEIVMVIYEGDITTEQEIDPDSNKLVDVTRHRRTKKLKEVAKLLQGSPTEIEIIDTLKAELSKDKTRTPIDEQKND